MVIVKSREANLPTPTTREALLTAARIQANKRIDHAPSVRSLKA